MKSKTAGQTYDRLSRIYHALESRFEAAPRKAGLQMLNAQPGEVVLEIGPGAGSALAELAKSVSPGGFVAGIDLSSGMLGQARRRAPVGAHLVRGDARLLPFRHGSFDAIFSSFTIELFSETEIALVLAECHHLLHPGGRLQVVCLGMGQGKARLRRLYEVIHRRFPSVIDCRPIAVHTLMEEAGFRITTRSETLLYGLPVDVVLGLK